MNRTYKYQVRLVSPVEERNCNKLCSTTIVHQYSEMVFSPTNFESFFYMAETICSFFFAVLPRTDSAQDAIFLPIWQKCL